MNVCIVLVTYNRLDYTRKTIARLLEDQREQFDLHIWDNASTDGTVDYLKNEVNDSRISDIIFSKENIGQTAAVNKIWSNSKSELLGKLDNDCLITPGWTRILARAHRDIPKLGVVACWHYFPDDFDYERAKHKIQEFGGHQILRHPWTCGTGLLLKKETFEKFGPIKEKSTTQYWCRLAAAGYINGFYYPLVFQEHMDDPKSKHSRLKDEASYQSAKQVNFGINSPGQETFAGRWRWRQQVLDNLLDGPWDVKYYTGWRSRLRRVKSKIVSTAFKYLGLHG
jgi:glycosyltransferase involved in cell wall biosynthesis